MHENISICQFEPNDSRKVDSWYFKLKHSSLSYLKTVSTFHCLLTYKWSSTQLHNLFICKWCKQELIDIQTMQRKWIPFQHYYIVFRNKMFNDLSIRYTDWCSPSMITSNNGMMSLTEILGSHSGEHEDGYLLCSCAV